MSFPRLTEIFEKIFNSSSEKLKCEIDVNSGTNVIGKVGIDQTTDGTTNKVQARNATHDNFNANANIQVNDMNVSSTNPVNVTSNSATVSDSQTRPDNTTAYTAGDVVGTDAATNLEFANVNSVSGGTVIITGVGIMFDVNAVPSGMSSFRLHIYTSEPTAIADNTAYNLPSADRDKYAGWIDIDVLTDIGDTIFARMNNVNFQVTPSARTLYGLVETRGAYTPSAETAMSVSMDCLEV